MMKKKRLIVISLILISSFILISIGISYSLFYYQLKGKTKNKLVTGIYSSCEYENGTEWVFDYTGSEQTFTVPCDGEYQLETWGASGGNYSDSCIGGYGAYSSGSIQLSKIQNIYVNIGGAGSGNGSHTYQKGGYNGGGNATPDSDGHTRQSSGGGATHLSFTSGILANLENDKDNILIVAGAGAGGAANSAIMCVSGGSGGGISGNSGSKYYESDAIWGIGHGGTQTSGGTYEGSAVSTAYYINGSFGNGASSVYTGGGGGYYGGASAIPSAGGGSGYIGNPLLTNKVMYCYNCTESSDESTKTISTTNVSETPISNYAKKGNGYAKITLVKSY